MFLWYQIFSKKTPPTALILALIKSMRKKSFVKNAFIRCAVTFSLQTAFNTDFHDLGLAEFSSRFS